MYEGIKASANDEDFLELKRVLEAQVQAILDEEKPEAKNKKRKTEDYQQHVIHGYVDSITKQQKLIIKHTATLIEQNDMMQENNKFLNRTVLALMRTNYQHHTNIKTLTKINAKLDRVLAIHQKSDP